MAGQSFFAADESAETIFFSLSVALCGQAGQAYLFSELLLMSL